MLQIQATTNSYLLETLCKACSQNPLIVKEAESQLQQMEIQSGYCYNLLVCFRMFPLLINLLN